MSKLGQLIVPIDADLAGLRRAVKQAEGIMRQSARQLGEISSQMAQKISLPLAGIGVASVKAFADLERLQSGLTTTMQAAGYSTQQAAAEMKALQEAAKLPGLDFEQAVKGSVRLQNVGFAAEEARKILMQLANAVSMSGGTSQELDSVTRQFGQMVAKGRIMQEDLTIIQENMPIISDLMEKAFGTRSAERLREMGVSAKDFVGTITKEMEKLPRVSGGLANSIVNAMMAMKMAAADFGNTLNEKLRIGERLNGFADWLTGLSQKFKELSPATQSAVLGIGVFALALGPAIRAGSILVNGIGSMVTGLMAVRNAMIAAQAAGGGISAMFAALNISSAGLFSAIAVGVGVVMAIAVAFKALAKDTSAAAKAQETVKNIQVQAAQASVEQQMKVESLIDTIKKENVAQSEKRAALEELKRISPEYFGRLDLEKSKIEDITKAQGKYIKFILATAEIEAAQAKLIENKKKLLDTTQLQAEAETTLGEKFVMGLSALGNLTNATFILGANRAKEEINRRNIVQGIDVENNALADLIRTKTLEIETTKEATSSKVKSATATDLSISKAKIYKEALSDVQKELDKAKILGGNTFEQQATAIKSGLDKLLDSGFSPESPQVKKFLGMLRSIRGSVAGASEIKPLQLPQSVQSISPKIDVKEFDLSGLTDQSYLEYLKNVSFTAREMDASLNLGQSAAMGLQTGFQTLAESAGPAFDGLANSLMGVEGAYRNAGVAALAAGMQMVKAALAATLAKAIQDSMAKSGHPLIGIALAGIAVGAVNALFGKINQSLQKAPKFAKGGMVHGPTMAMVGDNPNARVDPEVIAPLSKLRGMIGDGDRRLSGTFRVSGTDLVLVLEKAQQQQKRTRGR